MAIAAPPLVQFDLAESPFEDRPGRWFDDLPAWIISMVLHMVAVLLAGMWFVQPPREDRRITLSATIGENELTGDELEWDASAIKPPSVETPGPLALDALASLDPPEAQEVTLPQPLAGELPPTDAVAGEAAQAGATSAVALTGALAGRDPRQREELVRREGGTSATEAAVALGLKWLARHQNANGSWSLHAFHLAPGASGQPDGLGQESDTAGTALALLPFLGAGQTHRSGEYQALIARGLDWLVEQQADDGDLRGRGIGRMYAHGQAAIVLCEGYALTRDPALREPAQKALDFIVRAQHRAGGWRYTPGEPGDTSVFGWQLMALRSGKLAYLVVPQTAFQGATRYLNRAKADRIGARYGYMPGHRPSPTMTAEALLCRQYLGWSKDHVGLQSGAKYLLQDHLPSEQSPDIYYWYYATQVMHHVGGRSWENWNRQMRRLLVELQRTDGDLAGSWDPRGPFSRDGGRIYMTSLAICTLEVYYRYLPMYRDGAVQESPRSAETRATNEARVQ